MEKQIFTEQDLLDTLTTYLWPQYCKYTAIHGLLEFEDLVQECALGFYEPMKSTGIQRLKYYNDKFDWKHVRNIVRLCTYQCVPNYLKSNLYKYRPVSLNAPLSQDDEGGTELIDLVPALDEGLLEQTEVSDIMSTLNQEQLDVVNDLLAGYTKTFLRDKYKRFDAIVEEVRGIVKSYYHDCNEQHIFSR